MLPWGKHYLEGSEEASKEKAYIKLGFLEITFDIEPEK